MYFESSTVINDALHSGYNLIWVCEDDIEVVRDPVYSSQYIQDLDRIVGRDHWDILFTFRDYRQSEKEYLSAYGAAYRPDIDTRNQEKFNINQPISED